MHGREEAEISLKINAVNILFALLKRRQNKRLRLISINALQLDSEHRKAGMAKKMCEICGDMQATVPDRERMGRLINRVCSSCHALRLAGDMKRILELHEKRMAQIQNSQIAETGKENSWTMRG